MPDTDSTDMRSVKLYTIMCIELAYPVPGLKEHDLYAA